MNPKMLVACEHSGTVRDAFLELGFDVVSCDLLPCDSARGNHYQGDVLDLISNRREWDVIIAHPDCTFIANSGVKHLHTDLGRWFALHDACQFFNLLQNANARFICIENPIPHKYAVAQIGKYQQLVQPWQFGHGEVKATCFWLKNLPTLLATNIVSGRKDSCHKQSPGPNRGYWRSITYPGVADAMKCQWGSLIAEAEKQNTTNQGVSFPEQNDSH